MLRRTKITIETIVLVVMMVILACCGVLMGLIREWPKMGLDFFLAFYIAELNAFLLLNHKIESRFIKLEELITGKSGSDRLVDKVVPNSVFICMLIFLPAMLVLSMLACNRGQWLAVSIFLATFLITNAAFKSFMIWLKIKAYSVRLEKVISNDKEITAHIESKK